MCACWIWACALGLSSVVCGGGEEGGEGDSEGSLDCAICFMEKRMEGGGSRCNSVIPSCCCSCALSAVDYLELGLDTKDPSAYRVIHSIFGTDLLRVLSTTSGLG